MISEKAQRRKGASVPVRGASSQGLRLGLGRGKNLLPAAVHPQHLKLTEQESRWNNGQTGKQWDGVHIIMVNLQSSGW